MTRYNPHLSLLAAHKYAGAKGALGVIASRAIQKIAKQTHKSK